MNKQIRRHTVNTNKTYINVNTMNEKVVPLCRQAINGLYESEWLIENKLVPNFKRVAQFYGMRVDTVSNGERNCTYDEYDKTLLLVSFEKSERVQFAEFCMML